MVWDLCAGFPRSCEALVRRFWRIRTSRFAHRLLFADECSSSIRMDGSGPKDWGRAKSITMRAVGVLRHRAFFFFWIGAFISNTGNWTENAAQSWAVTSQTRGDPHQGLMVEILQFADF